MMMKYLMSTCVHTCVGISLLLYFFIPGTRPDYPPAFLCILLRIAHVYIFSLIALYLKKRKQKQ